ncbi:MAG: divergent polysaccharide deacetylase family protein [Pseudomonadota bacterium]
MNQDSELNKPLRKRKSASSSSRRAVIVTLSLVFLVFAGPFFHFYDGWSQLASLVTREEENVVIVENTEPVKSNDAEETQLVDEDQETYPADRTHTLDPDGGDLQVVESEGQLVAITPRKPPTRRQEASQAHLPDPELIERGATGVIPKKSADGLRAMDVYSRQPDTEGNFGIARVVIVIGGLGISQTSTQQAVRDLPPSVTLAFAPYGNSLPRWVQDARKQGHELLLQVPMEPLDFPQNNPGPHTIKATADLEENLANLHWAMSRITNYVGISNYLGNKILQQPASLSPVFAEIAGRGLLFFEDGSVKNSVGKGVAIKELLPYASADILLDQVRSRSAIVEKLNQLSEQAKRTGLAIAIGNAFPETINLVSQYATQAARNGIEITPLTAIVKDPGS